MQEKERDQNFMGTERERYDTEREKGEGEGEGKRERETYRERREEQNKCSNLSIFKKRHKDILLVSSQHDSTHSHGWYTKTLENDRNSTPHPRHKTDNSSFAQQPLTIVNICNAPK